MTDENEIRLRISKVRSVFMESSEFAEKLSSVDFFVDEVKKSSNETRPIIIESFAFILSERDLLEKDFSLSSWDNFKQQVENRYETALLVGLGWALGKQEMSHETLDLKLNEESLIKIYDGIGYYFGFFRHRQTVKNQVFPQFIPNVYLPAFFYGIGRTLWYVSGGNLEVLSSLLTLFEQKNQAFLWTGIGIASAFVGGCSKEHITILIELSNSFQDDFLKGLDQAKQTSKNYAIN